MALTFNGKVFRNLQEQVQYITLWLSANALANEMGIKTLGRVDSEADLPANDPDHPFQYGDAYMVGEEGETPYRMSIWTRDAGDGNPGWFDIGYFPTAPDQFSLVEINGQVVHIFNADTKLEKVTTATTLAQLYYKAADGTQGMVDVSDGADGGSVAKRTATGQIVCEDPTADKEAATKKYVDDNAVHKQTGASSYFQVYGKNTDGTQAMCNANANVTGGALVIRQSNGNVKLPLTPVNDDDGACKKYVDDNATGTRYIHSLLLTYEISASLNLYIHATLVNRTATAITGMGYDTFRDMEVHYGSVADTIGYGTPCAVLKCPTAFHGHDFPDPYDGILYMYDSAGTLTHGTVNHSDNTLTVVDSVTLF